jgi:hypothetical protein
MELHGSQDNKGIFMAILVKEEIVIPEKRLNKLWVRKIDISASEPGGDAKAQIAMVPYNDEGLYSIDDSIYLNVENIAEKVKDPKSNIAKAMYFLLASIQEEYSKEN